MGNQSFRCARGTREFAKGGRGWFHRSSEDGTTSSGQMSFGFFDLLTHALATNAPDGAKRGFICASANMGDMLSLAA